MSGDQLLLLLRLSVSVSRPGLPLSDLQAVVSARCPTHRETETPRVMSPKAKRQFGDLGSALLTLEHPLDAVKKTNITQWEPEMDPGWCHLTPEEFPQPNQGGFIQNARGKNEAIRC